MTQDVIPPQKMPADQVEALIAGARDYVRSIAYTPVHPEVASYEREQYEIGLRQSEIELVFPAAWTRPLLDMLAEERLPPDRWPAMIDRLQVETGIRRPRAA